jgi:hypothetical protein
MSFIPIAVAAIIRAAAGPAAGAAIRQAAVSGGAAMAARGAAGAAAKGAGQLGSKVAQVGATGSRWSKTKAGAANTAGYTVADTASDMVGNVVDEFNKPNPGVSGADLNRSAGRISNFQSGQQNY